MSHFDGSPERITPMPHPTDPTVPDNRRLLLACGNPLRGDDGIGIEIAEAFEQDSSLRVVLTQQFTPDLAEVLRQAETVVFVDASATTPAGELSVVPLLPAEASPHTLTHHLQPASLLRWTQELYEVSPRRAYAVTVGGSSFALGETLSHAARAAIPSAIAAIHAIFAETESIKTDPGSRLGKAT